MKMKTNLKQQALRLIAAGLKNRPMWNKAITHLEEEGWYDFYDEHEIPAPIEELALEIGLLWDIWEVEY